MIILNCDYILNMMFLHSHEYPEMSHTTLNISNQKKTKYSTKNVKMEIKTFKFLKEIFSRQPHYFIYQLILQNNHAQDI